MAREVEVIHWKGADTSVWMPYAPAIKVKRGDLVFIAECTGQEGTVDRFKNIVISL